MKICLPSARREQTCATIGYEERVGSPARLATAVWWMKYETPTPNAAGARIITAIAHIAMSVTCENLFIAMSAMMTEATAETRATTM